MEKWRKDGSRGNALRTDVDSGTLMKWYIKGDAQSTKGGVPLKANFPNKHDRISRSKKGGGGIQGRK